MSKKQTLQQFITDLPKVKTRMIASVHASTQVETANILELIKLRSPLDKGLFRRNWEMRKLGRTASKRMTFRLENRTFYGPWLDLGAEPGREPWGWPNAKNPGPVSKSGKLRIENGRVWAGGKSPEGFVTGGIVNQVIFYNVARQVDLANNLADSVIGVL